MVRYVWVRLVKLCLGKAVLVWFVMVGFGMVTLGSAVEVSQGGFGSV